MPESVMDAVNAALGDAGTPAAAEPELETPAPAGDEFAGDVDAGDGAPAADATEGDAAAAAADASAADEDGTGLDEEGRPLARDPVTGKFVKPGVDAAAVDKAKDGKPVGDGAAVDGKKPPDPINDPIPTGLKPATEQRMRSLIKTAKDLTTERDTVQSNFAYMIEGVKATGTTPEQYGEILSFMALFNSGDQKQQGEALDLLEGMADRLATLIGRERTVGDPFSEHADLKEAIAKGQITAQYAKEVARTRNQNKFKNDLSTAANARNAADHAAAQELSTARDGLNALEASLAKSDPQYAAKKAQLVPILKPIFKSIPPSQWQAKFQEAYTALKVRTAPKPPVVPANQPLRAGGGGGGAGGGAGSGMKSAPSSALDAVNAALAGMGR